jgi:hypothetical protein
VEEGSQCPIMLTITITTVVGGCSGGGGTQRSILITHFMLVVVAIVVVSSPAVHAHGEVAQACEALREPQLAEHEVVALARPVQQEHHRQALGGSLRLRTHNRPCTITTKLFHMRAPQLCGLHN